MHTPHIISLDGLLQASSASMYLLLKGLPPIKSCFRLFPAFLLLQVQDLQQETGGMLALSAAA